MINFHSMRALFNKKNLLFLLAIIIITLSIRLIIGPRTVDDAFITFRYARNIIEGKGFVYNPGERILGTTTPLFTLLLSAFYLATANLSRIAFVICTIADISTAIIIFLTIIEVTNSSFAAISGALLFSFSAGSIRFTAGGMETAVFTLLIVLASWLFLKDKYIITAGIASLATLTRPEGVILLFLLWVIYFIKFRQIPWKMVLTSSIILLPWVIFSTLYFGSPIPHSVSAKGTSYNFPPLFALKNLINYLASYTLPVSHLKPSGIMKYGFLALWVAFSVLSIIKTYQIRRLNFVIYWIFPMVYLGAYTIANPPVWEWYAVPIVPFSVIVFVVGFIELVDIVKPDKLISERKISMFGKIAFISGLFIVGLFQLTFIHRHDPRNGRELVYQDISQRMQDKIIPGDVIAAPEIGVLGYLLSDTRILDTQGLISNSAIPYRMEINQYSANSEISNIWMVGSSIPEDLILDELPEFVITLDVFARRIINNENFTSSYDLILREPSTVFGSEAVLVFQKK